MKALNRRKFIQQSSALAGVAALVPSALMSQTVRPSQFEIGFQSWIVRNELQKDFIGTMKQLVGMGYQSMELCSPAGYAQAGFGHLQQYKAGELKKIINDAGLSCISCHYGMPELRNNLQERIDFAKELGLTQMVAASFWLPKNAPLSEWQKAANELNKIGEQTKNHGLQMVFHNHNGELEKIDGQIIYDVLLKELDDSVVKLQFQVWVVIMGYKAADYFRKHPGRFISAHLYDWPGEGDKQVPVGKGIVDWKDFFEAANVGGLKNCFVEMGMENLKESAEFLKNL